jgi:hypothetical protein
LQLACLGEGRVGQDNGALGATFPSGWNLCPAEADVKN